MHRVVEWAARLWHRRLPKKILEMQHALGAAEATSGIYQREVDILHRTLDKERHEIEDRPGEAATSGQAKRSDGSTTSG